MFQELGPCYLNCVYKYKTLILLYILHQYNILLVRLITYTMAQAQGWAWPRHFGLGLRLRLVNLGHVQA